MTRHSSPHNQTTIPVLDRDGMPTSPTRPSRARRWLESGKAVKCWKHGRFAVRLKSLKVENCHAPDLTLNINPGTRRTGMTVMLRNQEETRVIAACELRHRGVNISQAMASRRTHRKNRRGRLRRRPARFDNRTRKPDWLPPSMESLRANILTNAKHLMALFPVADIVMESCLFDPRLMRDPEIAGAAYQRSERGQMQVRQYVFQRDRRTCQYCGKTGGRLETDHIVPRSRNGPYRISNLITACKKCNQAKNNLSLEEFLKDDPGRRERVRRQLKKSLSSATQMNWLMHLLRSGLTEIGVTLTETDSVSTAHTRSVLGVRKTPVNDAACLGEPGRLADVPENVLVIRSTGHGKRQMLTPPNRYGTPRYKEGPEGRNSPYRTYCRLSRERQGLTTTPGHKLRQRRAKGITSGDLVGYTHPKDGEVRGYATLANRNTRANAAGKKRVKLDAVTLLARGNGYQYHMETNTGTTRERK